MDLRHYFNPVPVATTIYDPLRMCVERVAAHIESRWLGTDRPWYGMLTEPIMPTTTWWLQFGKDLLWGEKVNRIKRGVLLDGRIPPVYFVHCLNGNPPRSYVPVREIKLHRIGASTVLEMPYGHKDASLVYSYEPSDHINDGYETANFLNGTLFYTSERKRNTRAQEQLKDTASYLAYLKEQEHETT